MIATQRLLLREWRDADLGPFAAMNADPVVMEFFPETYPEDRTRRFVELIRTRWRELGYSLWAVERQDSGRFIGYVGLWPATFPAHFTPAVEVGWRLTPDQWGHGYATEGHGPRSTTASTPSVSTRSCHSHRPSTCVP